MTSPFTIEFSPAQVQELEQVRDHHPKAYVRVKAAGILKVWAGSSRRQVASHGLLKPVRRETVQRWIDRYQHEGVAGLLVKSGRGRKPAFSPSASRGTNRGRRGTRRGASEPTALRTRAQ